MKKSVKTASGTEGKAVSKRGRRLMIAGAVVALCCTVSVPRTARAGDLESAKQALEKVKNDVGSESWDNVQADIKSTEEFLDGLPAADKDPVQKELDGLKTKADEGVKTYMTKQVLDTAKSRLDHAASEMGDSPGSAEEDIRMAVEKMSSDDAKKYVDADQLAKMMSRAKSLQAMAAGKQGDSKIARAQSLLESLDKEMAESPLSKVEPDDLDMATRRMNSTLSQVRGQLEGLPAEEPRVKAINEKVASYTKQLDAANNAAGAKEAEADMSRMWKSQKEYFAGWEEEKVGTSWEDFVHNSSELNFNLNMPKTVEAMSRMHSWFDESAVKELSTKYAEDAAIKADLADAQKVYSTAGVKLNQAFDKIMSEAEKGPMPTDSVFRERMDLLKTSADHWFAGTSYHDKNVARAQAVTDKWNGILTAAANGQAAALKTLTEQATAAWPAIAGSLKAEDGFTPDKIDQYKGKTIHLTGRNRLGWDYTPGSYNYETEINGMPVAGKYDANVAAAVASALKQTGLESLSDEDAWDVYAVVQGAGKIDKRVNVEGKVTVQGENVGTVTSEHHETVDCAVVRIIAMHIGPVGVGPDSKTQGPAAPVGGTATASLTGPGGVAAGSVKASGMPQSSNATPASSEVVTTGVTTTIISSPINTAEHLFECLICLAGSGLVMMRSKMPAVASPIKATAGGPAIAIPSIDEDPMTLAGLGLAGLGVVWLLVTLIIGDLLPAACLMLSGVYIAGDWFGSRRIIPGDLVSVIKPMAVPIAGATALFGVLHIFVGNWYLV